MDAAARRTRIEEQVVSRGEVAFAELAEALGVSEMTIRRDIEVLQSRGILRRVSGGAIALAGTSHEPSFGLRSAQSAAGKRLIGERIADLLSPGETVLLDSGSTVLAVARSIRGRRLGLTVVTPSIAVAVELADDPGTRVLLVGGEVRAGELSLIGSETENALARYNCDSCVLGVAGVDVERGLTDYHPREAGVKAVAITRAARVIVGAEEAKLGRVHLVTIAAFSAMSLLVTDAPDAHPAVVAARDAGIPVEVVSGDDDEPTDPEHDGAA
ncbi:MAG: DeoR/GlpR family DNA-binding transcription regulator [Naasia sp.]